MANETLQPINREQKYQCFEPTDEASVAAKCLKIIRIFYHYDAGPDLHVKDFLKRIQQKCTAKQRKLAGFFSFNLQADELTTFLRLHPLS